MLELSHSILSVESLDVLLSVEVNATLSSLGKDKFNISFFSVVVNGLENNENELLVDVVELLNFGVTLGDQRSNLSIKGGINLSEIFPLLKSSLDEGSLEGSDLSLTSGNNLGNFGSVGLSLFLESLSDGLSKSKDIGIPELVSSEHGLSHVEFVVVSVLVMVLVPLFSVSCLVVVISVLGLLLVELPDLIELVKISGTNSRPAVLSTR